MSLLQSHLLLSQILQHVSKRSRSLRVHCPLVYRLTTAGSVPRQDVVGVTVTSDDEKQKCALTPFFFYHRDAETFVSYHSQTRYRSSKPNPTGEITKILVSCLILIILVITLQGSSAGRSLSFPASQIYQPLVTASPLKPGDKVTSAAKSFQSVCCGLLGA